MGTFQDTRPLPGGRISVDLLNTSWGPPGAPTDWLVDDRAVKLFAAGHGLALAAADIDAARQALVEARGIIQALFESAIDGEVDGKTAAEVNGILARSDVRFLVADEGPQVAVSSSDTRQRLAVEAVVDAVAMLGDRPDRIRTCEHADCTLWFLDTSKAGRRRWCSMDQCGNRAKARRHYARSTGSTA